jgi:hypothetical protein
VKLLHESPLVPIIIKLDLYLLLVIFFVDCFHFNKKTSAGSFEASDKIVYEKWTFGGLGFTPVDEENKVKVS